MDIDRIGGAYAATLLPLIGAGGPVVIILLAMSVVSLAVIVAKAISFMRVGLGRPEPAFTAAAALAQGRAVAVPQGATHPAMALVAAASATLAAGLDRETMREEVLRVGRAELAGLRSHLRLLEIVAALAPLLGLFGTVLGMIAAFRALEQAGGAVDPAVLSGGIWQALLTTAVGLAVAMPVVAALAWLERRVERAAEVMEDVTSRVLAMPILQDRHRAHRGHADAA